MYFMHDNTRGYSDADLIQLNMRFEEALVDRFGRHWEDDGSDSDEVKAIGECVITEFDSGEWVADAKKAGEKAMKIALEVAPINNKNSNA